MFLLSLLMKERVQKAAERRSEQEKAKTSTFSTGFNLGRPPVPDAWRATGGEDAPGSGELV